MITQINIEKFPSYELGMERGMEKTTEMIIKQLLKTFLPKQIALLTNVPLEKIVEVKTKIEH